MAAAAPLVLYALAMPPVGAMYFRQVALPMLGTQNVWFFIRNHKTAEIEFHGPITVKEQIPYVQNEDGSLSFELGPKMRDMMRRMRTTLSEARYDAKHDRAIVRVHPPVVPAITIAMERIYEVPSLTSSRWSSAHLLPSSSFWRR